MKKKIGVVLAGCGVFDGSEIHESVLTLLALERAGAEAVCLAPDKEQLHVINHLTGEEMPGPRNVQAGKVDPADGTGYNPGPGLRPDSQCRSDWEERCP